jgi:hypothetical protein
MTSGCPEPFLMASPALLNETIRPPLLPLTTHGLPHGPTAAATCCIPLRVIALAGAKVTGRSETIGRRYLSFMTASVILKAFIIDRCIFPLIQAQLILNLPSIRR